LEKAEARIAQLNELGFSYFLGGKEKQSKAGQRRTKTATSKSARHKPSDTECGYCGFKTEPSRDKRSHRSQTKKRPFNEKELAQLGDARRLIFCIKLSTSSTILWGIFCYQLHSYLTIHAFCHTDARIVEWEYGINNTL
jgi:hypothetical protein